MGRTTVTQKWEPRSFWARSLADYQPALALLAMCPRVPRHYNHDSPSPLIHGPTPPLLKKLTKGFGETHFAFESIWA
jgi:hypothetical protein